MNLIIESKSASVDFGEKDKYITNVVDWGTSELAFESSQQQWGEVFRTSSMLSRTIEITAFVFASNSSEMQSRRHTLQAALNVNEDVRLYGYHIDNSGSTPVKVREWYIDCRAKSTVSWSEDYKESGSFLNKCKIVLIAHDPFFHTISYLEDISGQETYRQYRRGEASSYAYFDPTPDSNHYFKYYITNNSDRYEYCPVLEWEVTEDFEFVMMYIRSAFSGSWTSNLTVNTQDQVSGTWERITIEAGSTVVCDPSRYHIGIYKDGALVRDLTRFITSTSTFPFIRKSPGSTGYPNQVYFRIRGWESTDWCTDISYIDPSESNYKYGVMEPELLEV